MTSLLVGVFVLHPVNLHFFKAMFFKLCNMCYKVYMHRRQNMYSMIEDATRSGSTKTCFSQYDTCGLGNISLKFGCS